MAFSRKRDDPSIDINIRSLALQETISVSSLDNEVL